MADNISVTAGSGTTIAADDISGVLHQRIKLTWGVDGSAVDASASNPLPTSAAQSGTWNITNISGTVSLPTGAATAANQSTGNGYLSTIATQAASTAPVKICQADEYETVAASATDQALGATGATGDRLSGLIIIPATTSPGAVSIKDGAGSAITVFTGGASSVSTLIPFTVPLGLISLAGAWKVTTGANVSVIAAGDFS